MGLSSARKTAQSKSPNAVSAVVAPAKTPVPKVVKKVIPLEVLIARLTSLASLHGCELTQYGCENATLNLNEIIFESTINGVFDGEDFSEFLKDNQKTVGYMVVAMRNSFFRIRDFLVNKYPGAGITIRILSSLYANFHKFCKTHPSYLPYRDKTVFSEPQELEDLTKLIANLYFLGDEDMVTEYLKFTDERQKEASQKKTESSTEEHQGEPTKSAEPTTSLVGMYDEDSSDPEDVEEDAEDVEDDSENEEEIEEEKNCIAYTPDTLFSFFKTFIMIILRHIDDAVDKQGQKHNYLEDNITFYTSILSLVNSRCYVISFKPGKRFKSLKETAPWAKEQTGKPGKGTASASSSKPQKFALPRHDAPVVKDPVARPPRLTPGNKKGKGKDISPIHYERKGE